MNSQVLSRNSSRSQRTNPETDREALDRGIASQPESLEQFPEYEEPDFRAWSPSYAPLIETALERRCRSEDDDGGVNGAGSGEHEYSARGVEPPPTDYTYPERLTRLEREVSNLRADNHALHLRIDVIQAHVRTYADANAGLVAVVRGHTEQLQELLRHVRSNGEI
ncbi:hypothetical protein LTR62_004860 [Meristemomyces frigidus]|uniref:Uncharacterized protein n=1 Tax=Meristemomyces frigidus TaxID=1508187 RepID=A0AAN7TH86_9PEZI|nr:hypothetical protein LTR62_004860 [Meristemomyces frigidus]